MTSLINRISSNPMLPGLFLFLVCLGALSTAYFVEYVLGIEPCELCLYQRIPYAAVGLFSLFVIVGKPGSFTQQVALLGCGIAFLVGASLAFYHFGVEEKWWSAACGGAQSMDMSLDDLKASIMAEPLKPCDSRDWVMFGLSITVYNTVASLFLAAISFTSLAIIRKLKAHTK